MLLGFASRFAPLAITLFLSAAALLTQGASAQEAPEAITLSLAEALDRAHKSNPVLSAATARVAAAQARVQAANAQPNPTLSLAQPFALQGQTGGFDEGVLITQAVELGGKRAARVAVARGELAAAQSEAIGNRTALDFSVRQAYFNALRASDARDAAAAALKTTQQFLDAGQLQFQAGDVARRDVVRAQIEVARAQGDLTKAQTETENQLATLRSLLGLDAQASLKLSDTLVSPAENFDLPALETLALKNRADVQSATLLKAARQNGIHAAQIQNKPDAFVEGRRTKLDPTTRGTSVRFGVTFPLFDRGSKRAAVAEAQAALSEQQATTRETERAALLEVRQAFNNWQSARRIVESFRTGRLAQAKELLDMEQTGYEKGASSYLEVLDAQRVLRAEQTEYDGALADLNVARADLQRAVGGELP